MLKNDLYTIEKITTNDSGIESTVQLKVQHEIFKGHFPDEPVLPGACMMQMIKEILETHIGKKLILVKAIDIKFLSVIQPTGPPLQFAIQYTFTESLTNVSAKITKNEVVCCKMKAAYKVKD